MAAKVLSDAARKLLRTLVMQHSTITEWSDVPGKHHCRLGTINAMGARTCAALAICRAMVTPSFYGEGGMPKVHVC